jgi:hypothetical protein
MFAMCAVLVGVVASAEAAATARPFVFIGKADNPNHCGDPYPAGAKIVSAGWLKGLGLPDNGGSNENPSDPPDLPNKNDIHYGLLLSKNGPTSVCSSAGADIVGLQDIQVQASTQLGFDYRNGSHCGGGAPRFNVSWVDSLGNPGFSFVGNCSLATATPSPQDSQWTQLRWNVVLDSFPTIPLDATITEISIVFDEGTSSPPPAGNAPSIGLAVIDNIYLDGVIIRKGTGVK